MHIMYTILFVIIDTFVADKFVFLLDIEKLHNKLALYYRDVAFKTLNTDIAFCNDKKSNKPTSLRKQFTNLN